MITINEIKALTGEMINSMTNKELIEYTTRATMLSKQRVGQLNKAGFINTPAYQTMGKWEIGKIKIGDIENMSQSELRKTLKKETLFLNDQTSTVAGERQRLRNFLKLATNENKSEQARQSDITKMLKKMGQGDLRSEYKDGINYDNMKAVDRGYIKLRELFDLIEQVESLDPSMVYEMGSSEFLGSMIETYLQGLDDAVELTDYLRDRLNGIQEENEKKSSSFGWGDDAVKNMGMRFLSREINKNLPRGMTIQKLTRMKNRK